MSLSATASSRMRRQRRLELECSSRTPVPTLNKRRNRKPRQESDSHDGNSFSILDTSTATPPPQSPARSRDSEAASSPNNRAITSFSNEEEGPGQPIPPSPVSSNNSVLKKNQKEKISQEQPLHSSRPVDLSSFSIPVRTEAVAAPVTPDRQGGGNNASFNSTTPPPPPTAVTPTESPALYPQKNRRSSSTPRDGRVASPSKDALKGHGMALDQPQKTATLTRSNSTHSMSHLSRLRKPTPQQPQLLKNQNAEEEAPMDEKAENLRIAGPPSLHFFPVMAASNRPPVVRPGSALSLDATILRDCDPPAGNTLLPAPTSTNGGKTANSNNNHALVPAVTDGNNYSSSSSSTTSDASLNTNLMDGHQHHRRSLSADRSSNPRRAALSPSYEKIVQAIQNQATRPANLTTEEKVLWDALQSALTTTRTELYVKRARIEKQLKDDNQALLEQLKEMKNGKKEIAPTLFVAASEGEETRAITIANSEGSEMQVKYQKAQAQLQEQQNEHDRALRAIQRVLADVTTEREVTEEQLQRELEEAHQARDKTVLEMSQQMKQLREQHVKEMEALKRKMDVKRENKMDPESSFSLQEELEELRDKYANLGQANASLKEQLAQHRTELLVGDGQPLDLRVQEELQGLQAELLELQAAKDAKTKEAEELKCQMQEQQREHLQNFKVKLDLESVPMTQVQLKQLQSELQEKTSSLENAKLIIASLENANGALARELRAKLKEKEDELSNLTSTSADRKRTLDSLATELRELQRQQGEVQAKERRHYEQFANQRALCDLLQKNVKALRQAAVRHEALNDQESVDQISHIVSETFTSLKSNLETWEAYLNSAGDHVDGSFDGSNDSVKVKQMEASLSQKNEELKNMRNELDRFRIESNKETSRLHAEIQNLREQLTTNMDILAKKGRELSVLRDSLKVDDDDVGYISDDNTDGDESDHEPGSSSGQFPYGPARTATLFAHGGSARSANPNAAESSDATASELKMLKSELVKAQKEREAKAAELQAEKESLANAKMIISSLEKANKSMLEDLRSRLHDSNTAIASLLEKSMEHDKTTALLREELDKVKKERDNEERQYKQLIAKLRDENLVFSMRLAAKDRELDELHDTLAQYEEPIKHNRQSAAAGSVEEKKEDPSGDDV